VVISLEQGMVIQGRRVFFSGLGQSLVVAMGGDDGIDFKHTAAMSAGVYAAVETKQYLATAVGYLAEKMQSHRAPVINPSQRHSGNIGAQDLLLKICHFTHNLREPRVV